MDKKCGIGILAAIFLLLMLPACAAGPEQSQSAEETTQYEDLAAELNENEEAEAFAEDDEEVEDDEDDEEDDEEFDDEEYDDEEDEEGEEDEEDEVEQEERDVPDLTSYEARHKRWEDHENWRDKDVDNFKTAEEYADYYHDDYIKLLWDYYEEYGEGFLLEQAYLEAADYWESNQPWPEPEED